MSDKLHQPAIELEQAKRNMESEPDPKRFTKLYSKLAAVTKELDRIPKRGYNDFHNYHYALEADVKARLQELLPKHGLAQFITMESIEHEGNYCRVTLRISLNCTETGESISGLWQGVGMDKGDKAIYKAYTGAIKYWLMTNFLIPTGDDPEGDTETDKIADKKDTAKDQAKNAAKQQVQNTPQKPQNRPQSTQSKDEGINTLREKAGRLWSTYAQMESINVNDTSKKSAYAKQVVGKDRPSTKAEWGKLITALEMDIAQRKG